MICYTEQYTDTHNNRLSDGTPQSLLLDGNAITGNAAVTVLNSVKDSYQHISFALGSISNSGAMKIATCLLPDISNSLSNSTATAYSMVSLVSYTMQAYYIIVLIRLLFTEYYQ
jgi:hypothetical protein